MVKVICETHPISSTLIMHAVNKKKKKYIDSYVHDVNKKNKDSINQSPQLIISSDSYSLHAIYLPIHHITSKRFFCLFILQYFFDRSSLLCVSINFLLHSTLISLISLPTIFNSCVSYILQTTIRNNTYKYLSVLLSLRR